MLIGESGTGAVYSYDPVGSYERESCRAAGAAQSLIQPFLDNQVSRLALFTNGLFLWSDLTQIYFRNQSPAPGAAPFIPGNLPLATVLSIVVDSFTSATERHIEVGDGMEIYVVMKQGRSTDDLLGKDMLAPGMQVEELGALGEGGGERTFLVRAPLKRD